MLVDRDHVPLLHTRRRDPVEDEVQAMPPHDHGLRTTPRLDPEALLGSLRDVRVQCRRAGISCRSARHRSKERVSGAPTFAVPLAIQDLLYQENGQRMRSARNRYSLSGSAP